MQPEISKYANKTKKAFNYPELGKKTCSKCGYLKNHSEFYKHNQTKDGLHSWCKACCKIGNDKSRKKKYSTFEGRVTTFLRTCKTSSEKRGNEFDLDREFLLSLWNNQKGRCYYTNLVMDTQPANPQSVSIERLDSSIGYTKNNTVLVCNYINKMKTDLTMQDFIFFCKAVAKNN